MKTAIITGASGGLGTAVTNYLLQRNYTVIATVNMEQDKSHLPQHGSLFSYVADLADENAATSFVSGAIQKHGRIDACLLLAGGFAAGNFEKSNIKDISAQINLNFFTAYSVAHAVYAHMKSNKEGRIVFVGARPALSAAQGKNMVAYSLSKSLLFKLADILNEESKGTNVTASVIVPSTIDTPMNRKSMPDADPDKWVKPESIAAILDFIVSETNLRESVFKIYNNA